MAKIVIRKRSPRAPLISLQEAVGHAVKVYQAEGRHPASTDIVAQHLGYKSADNGAAKQLLAALGYFGLLERPSDGMLSVAKTVEEFKFAPDEDHRAKILEAWLTTPTVFSELLKKFPGNLPSAASLKFELIQKQFNPATADECVKAFVESVDYVRQATPERGSASATAESGSSNTGDEAAAEPATEVGHEQNQPAAVGAAAEAAAGVIAPTSEIAADERSDRIPVRLPRGRRAWLVIPSPFYEADKRRLISQIELLLTDDDEE